MILKNKRQKVKEFFNYNFLLKNRRGAEKILAVYWFAVLVIISVGVFSIVFSFQSPYDVRGLEASVLAGQVADCISNQGILNNRISEAFGISSIEEVSNPTNNLDDLTKAVTDYSSCNCGDSCEKYAEWIIKYSTEKNILDPLLVAGLIAQESSCNTLAGTGSSHGLMQINLKHCGKFGLQADKTECKNELINNPEKNIQIGIQILKDSYTLNGIKGKQFSDACTEEYQQKKYFGWEAALRGYNGWGCGKFLQGPKEGENIIRQDYFVDEVIVRYNNLRKILGKEPVTGTMKIDLLETCHLNFGDEKDSQHYFEAKFTNFTLGKFLGVAEEGDLRIKSLDINLQEEKESKVLSKFVERSFYSVDENNEKYLIKILSAVKKTKQNVK